MYNVERYIVECLDSVRKQSFPDFEVIIVDDGSSDRSKELVSNFIAQHDLKNFFLYTKKNGGVSSARNYGIKRAKGQWISFLDSDDWLEPECFRTLVDTLHKYPSDLVYGGYQVVDEETKNIGFQSKYNQEYGRLPDDLHGLISFSYSFARIYKKEIIDEYDILFDERIRYCEDNAFLFDYNSRIRSYSCTNTIVYNYRVNRQGSLTGSTILPKDKYYLWEHMQQFIRAFDPGTLQKEVVKSPHLCRVMWNALHTAICNDILEGKYRAAREKRSSAIAQIIIHNYTPHSRKETFFLRLLKYSFVLLCIFIRVYYANFPNLCMRKLVRFLSGKK